MVTEFATALAVTLGVALLLTPVVKRLAAHIVRVRSRRDRGHLPWTLDVQDLWLALAGLGTLIACSEAAVASIWYGVGHASCAFFATIVGEDSPSVRRKLQNLGAIAALLGLGIATSASIGLLEWQGSGALLLSFGVVGSSVSLILWLTKFGRQISCGRGVRLNSNGSRLGRAPEDRMR